MVVEEDSERHASGSIGAASAFLYLMLGALPALAHHDDPNVQHDFADPAFEDRWERLDRPVAEFGVDRTYWWGPAPYTPGLMEEYEQSPGGERLVQYVDKSRMEIINPNGDADELWHVTSGFLVVEMTEGRIQIGDASFREAEPADVPVAGVPDNPYGPTYAKLAERLDDPPLEENAMIADRIDRNGNVTPRSVNGGLRLRDQHVRRRYQPQCCHSRLGDHEHQRHNLRRWRVA
jgi:hypothetical protein